MLKERDAVKLYQMKVSASAQGQSMKGTSGSIAKLFGTSPRVVRDVWNRKTWCYATRHLWHLEDASAIGCDHTESNDEVIKSHRA